MYTHKFYLCLALSSGEVGRGASQQRVHFGIPFLIENAYCLEPSRLHSTVRRSISPRHTTVQVLSRILVWKSFLPYVQVSSTTHQWVPEHTSESQNTPVSPRTHQWVLHLTTVGPSWDTICSAMILKDELAVSHILEPKQHLFSESLEIWLPEEHGHADFRGPKLLLENDVSAASCLMDPHLI